MGSSRMAGSMQLGGILGTGLTGKLLGPIGWRGALQAYAVTGAVWAVPFFVLFRDRPNELARVNAAERELIGAGRSAAPAGNFEKEGTGDTFRTWLVLALKMCASVSIWADLVQAVLRAMPDAFCQTWCPAVVAG